jgi:ABC-type sugar transport system ATPase subunit
VLELIKRLRGQGLGVVLISHNLTDVFEVADRITVLRLGRYVGTFQAKDVTHEQLVGYMTGAIAGDDAARRASGEIPPLRSPDDDPAKRSHGGAS